MPNCINDPNYTYTGDEYSPMGRGFCPQAEEIGTEMIGNDDRIWVVYQTPVNAKRWIHKTLHKRKQQQQQDDSNSDSNDQPEKRSRTTNSQDNTTASDTNDTNNPESDDEETEDFTSINNYPLLADPHIDHGLREGDYVEMYWIPSNVWLNPAEMWKSEIVKIHSTKTYCINVQRNEYITRVDQITDKLFNKEIQNDSFTPPQGARFRHLTKDLQKLYCKPKE
tara:strand:- start:3218 stop:3886 length:669 start_codon:yes stop_codon:yes gene_type:complete